jgi:hypothetical protein
MPDNHSPDNQESSQQQPEPEPAEFSNRAARRRRGKDTSSSQAFGKVQGSGRRGPVQGPRQWSVRRSG